MRTLQRILKTAKIKLSIFRMGRKTKKEKAVEIPANSYEHILKNDQKILWFVKGPCAAVLLKSGGEAVLPHIDPSSASMQNEAKELINRAVRELKKEALKP